MVSDAVKKTIKYELISNFNAVKEADNWQIVIAIFAGVFALDKNFSLAILCLIALAVLQSKKDYDSGRVEAFHRERQGIPSRNAIRRMKMAESSH